MGMSFQKIQNYGGLADPQNFLSMKICPHKANDRVHFTFRPYYNTSTISREKQFLTC